MMELLAYVADKLRKKNCTVQNNRINFPGSEDQELPGSESGDSIPGQELYAHAGLSF
jgi:hypothetical protein